MDVDRLVESGQVRRRSVLAGLGAAITAAALTTRPAKAALDTLTGEQAGVMVTVPPPNGTDDTVTIKNAIATAGVGGSLAFQAGTYRVSATVQPAAGQIWTGAGLDDTTLKAVHVAQVMINSRGVFSLSDITLDLNKSALPTPDKPVLRRAPHDRRKQPLRQPNRRPRPSVKLCWGLRTGLATAVGEAGISAPC